jgi:hypothetical protein
MRLNDIKLIVALGMLLLCAAKTPAFAALPGQTCGQLGSTELSDDKANIIACLFDDATDTPPSHWRAQSVNLSACPAGQLISGVPYGVPVCSQLSCRSVSATPAGGNSWAVAQCNPDEFAMNGGGISINGCGGGPAVSPWTQVGFIHTTLPWGSLSGDPTWGGGWAVNGWGANIGGIDDTGKQVCTISYATCCKWVPAP